MENVKRFNTTGPCFPDEHYMLPALDRLPGIRELVAGGSYFVVHAAATSSYTRRARRARPSMSWACELKKERCK